MCVGARSLICPWFCVILALLPKERIPGIIRPLWILRGLRRPLTVFRGGIITPLQILMGLRRPLTIPKGPLGTLKGPTMPPMMRCWRICGTDRWQRARQSRRLQRGGGAGNFKGFTNPLGFCEGPHGPHKPPQILQGPYKALRTFIGVTKPLRCLKGLLPTVFFKGLTRPLKICRGAHNAFKCSYGPWMAPT